MTIFYLFVTDLYFVSSFCIKELNSWLGLVVKLVFYIFRGELSVSVFVANNNKGLL